MAAKDETSYDTELQMNEDGTCVKHPTVMLRETTPDGYTYQRDSCPQCEVELDTKLEEMKQKRSALDQKLQDLDLDDDDNDNVVKDPYPTKKKASSKKSPPQHQDDEEEWTHPNKLSLEALSQQMTRMQQMQDWLLMQKEQEMTMLRTKVEEQQRELIQKEVEMALLKEKLVQQEQRMQHELKLIKAAASKHHRGKRKKDKKSKSSSSSSHHAEKKASPPPPPTEIAAAAVPMDKHSSSSSSVQPGELEQAHVDINGGRGRPTKSDSVGELPLVSQAYDEDDGEDHFQEAQQEEVAAYASKKEQDDEDEYAEERKDKFDVNDTFVPNVVEEDGNAAAAFGFANKMGDNTDAYTVGNTVATSTYGEDRHKVVDQTVLDPYGDSGQYTGVVLLTTGMPHGLGRMLYEDDGRTYEGDWRHGRWHGYGKATFANGDSYEGEYRFDQRHGRGLYQWNDGRQYDGEFYEDKRHGNGTFQWPDGATYEGDFVHGQREGRGRYTFADGGQYVGDWVDGRYEGYGECEWEDGRSYKGEWKQGMAHGRGVETFADGTVRHDGLWDHDDPIVE